MVGIEPVDGRYRAYQLYMYSKERRAPKYIAQELLQNILSWTEFIFVANVKLDKSSPSAILAFETPKGKPKFELWMDASSGKVGIRSHMKSKKKKSIVFKKVPIAQASWHRIVIHFKDFNATNPMIHLYVDCQLFERKHFPLPLRQALLEDADNIEVRLGQLKNVGKDVLKFMVSYIFYCDGNHQNLRVIPAS